MMYMKILVTGGAGFIGSHLCERLLYDGHQVVCLDNFFSGQRSNVASLLKKPGFTLVEGDVTEPYDFAVDQIYNLACPASPVHYQRNPVGTVRTCVLGAIHALELAKRRGIPVLQASTSEVYGDPQVHPQPESYHGDVNPIGPRACYDEGKRCAETLFFDYHRQYGVHIKVVRIFNTYGPNLALNDGRVISNFIIAALEGKPIAVDGDGQQTRSFCYVDDLVEGMLGMMGASPDLTGPVNLGNPGEFTINELAALVLGLTDSRSRTAHNPARADDPRQRRPDISLAIARLGWQPTISLEEGLRRTIPYFRKALGLHGT
ncbi:MAG: putative sugar-nucleotide epimerase/dehydratase [Parcubacteria group bacterium Gr01-1014_31]|nr:MAG: putative sugar-nucleotide epimerase/dehydratase [Parcubacteria group bacterium Gr01-1014_31]